MAIETQSVVRPDHELMFMFDNAYVAQATYAQKLSMSAEMDELDRIDDEFDRIARAITAPY